MKTLLLIALVFIMSVFASCNEDNASQNNDTYIMKRNMQRSEDSLKDIIYNIRVTGQMVEEKIKQGVPKAERDKFEKEYMEMLNRRTDSIYLISRQNDSLIYEREKEK